MTLINWSLIKHPVNWLIVILMLIIAGFALDIILPVAAPQLAGGQS